MGKLTWFCPRCWLEVEADATICPRCGYDLQAYEQLPFEDKLILALGSPIEDSRIVATQLLARLRSRAAVPAFARLIETESSVYVLCEVARALAVIDHPQARALLARLSAHESILVQHCAGAALEATRQRERYFPRWRAR